jgi:hypothetical protein
VTDRLSTLLERAIATAAATREAHASDLGITPEELDARTRLVERREARRKALEGSGLYLPSSDRLRVIQGNLDRSEPYAVFERYCKATRVRPILILCGARGIGKTVACAWAIAHRGGGTALSASDIGRRIRPTRHEIEEGARRVRLDNSFFVLEDLGDERDPRNHRWAECFALLIENRLRRGQTLITSRLPKASFRERYDEKIIEDLNAHAFVVECASKKSLRKGGAGL